MKKICAALFTVFVSCYSLAQTVADVEKKYVNETIYRYKGGSYMKGFERLSFNDLGKEFSFSPVGFDLYNQAKRYRKISSAMQLISMGATVVMLSSVGSQNRNRIYIGVGIQFISMFISTRYSSLSAEQTNKALWQRNKDLLFGVSR